ncbi:MAG: hypothetical protein IT385_01705 [Deltaproteobacteria bacterium]|nr:hypothetical protein [Deltaproteobacteria bacterium]
MVPELQDYERILTTCEPWLVCRPSARAGLELAPLGVPIPGANLIDPQRVADGPFLHLVQALDRMTYGPVGLEMPSWVFYDCAVMPGALFGFARRASELAPWVRTSSKLPPHHDGLVPLSIIAAIPMAHRRAELVYTLCSINQVAPGAAPDGLWRLTLAMGAAALGIRTMVATAQWRSAQLGLYAGLGPLRLQTAWTPAHDIAETATFTVDAGPEAQRRLLAGELPAPGVATRHLDADDREEMRALQGEIEAGTPVWIVGPPEVRGARTRIPLQVGALDAPAIGRTADGWLRKFHG